MSPQSQLPMVTVSFVIDWYYDSQVPVGGANSIVDPLVDYTH